MPSIIGRVSRHSSPRIVGRASQLARLESSYARVATGELAFVLLSGEAGIGKTRLIREHAARVYARGGLVLVGESIQLGDTSLPYGPFLDVLGPANRGLPPGVAIDWAAADPTGRRRAVPVGPADGLGAQAALFASVVSALDRLAAERPVLLVLEDIHWADPASRDLLTYLVRRLRGSALQVIATFRSDALHRRHPLLPFLAEADRWPFTERIEVPRLDVQAVSELVDELVGEPPGRAAIEQVYARSDGIPFFVESILAEQATGPGRQGVATSELRGAWMAALSPVARRVLGAAAVLGRRPLHDHLLEIAGEPPEVVIAALRECADALLLLPSQVGSDAAYEFRHALLQEVAYDELLPAERTALHRRVATTRAAGVDFRGDVPVALAGEIAYHADRAHDVSLALRAADAAGRAATSALAFTDADRSFAMALELWSEVHGDEGGPELAALVGRASHAAGYANQPARAARYDRRRLDLTVVEDAAETATILHDLFWHLWDAGDVRDLVPTAERALGLVPVEPPSPARAIALADLGFARWSTCENQVAEELAREAVAVAEAVGDDVLEGRALLVLANATAGLGRTTAADALFAEASRRLRASRDCDGAARVAHWWANALEFDGSYERAIWVAEEGLVAARNAGVDIRHGDALRAVLAENLEHLGFWEEALAVAADGFNWGSNQPSEIWSHAVHARIAICRGELDGARRQLAATEHVQAAGPDRVWQAEELMSLAYAVGDVDPARACLAEGIAASPTPEREMALWWLLIRALDAEVERAVSARATGDSAGLSEAMRHARRCADLLDANAAAAIVDGGDGRLIRALADWSRALRSRLEDRSDPRAWATTVDQLEQIGTVWYTALARCRHAEALILQGARAAEVAPVLENARDTARKLETPPLLAEIERLARVAGIELDGDEPDPPVNDGDAVPARDAFGLSPRELEVLGLVAAGRTNREIGEALFISPKTASVHVTHIMEKLGVSSRVEAALAASRAGIGDDQRLGDTRVLGASR